jgi:anti-sigma B factor antagonist
MELNTRYLNGITIVDLIGRFDAQETAKVRQALTKAAALTTPAYIAVNLEGVKFIDSSGLAALVQGMKRCRKKGGDLFLYNLKQKVRIIFELTRLDKAFSIFPDEDAALKNFR